jgi:putative transposase
MPNHFHLLVRIREKKDILPLKPLSGLSASDRVLNGKSQTQTLSVVTDPDSGLVRKPTPHRQFSHLFNAYAQAFNHSYHRHGGLFETPFRRVPVTSVRYFRHLVWYIHNNPVHHCFCEHLIEYPWSSYHTIISVKPTKLYREKVIGWFDNKSNFIAFHKQNQGIIDINEFVID